MACAVEDCVAETHAKGLCQRHYKQDWYKRNRERIRSRTVTDRDRSEARERARLHYEGVRSDPERMERRREVGRSWARRNPDKIQANRRAQRARRSAATKVERVFRSKVWDRDHGICHICAAPADPDDWHLDHVVPLAAGGEHSYANVAVSHPKCNLRKGAKVAVA